MAVTDLAPADPEPLAPILTPDEPPDRRRPGVLVGALAIIVVVVLVIVVALATTGSRTAAAPANKINVGLKEFNIEVPTTVAPGKYSFHIANDGKAEHEFLVFRSDLAPSAYPLDGTDINEDGPGINKISDGDNIKPGASQTRTIDLTQPGTYLFVCNLPGHFHAGMFEQVTVR